MILLADLKDAPVDAVFFSGTFSPWHAGHQECVEQALSHKLNLVVCPDLSPWKDFQIKDTMTLQKQLNNYPVWLYTKFLNEKERNPTINWIQKLIPKQRSLLMGDDSFLSIEKWQESKRLCQILNRIYVVPRLGGELELEQQKKRLLSDNKNMQIVFLAHHAYEHLSSSLLKI
jgi:nicotinate-nucleotide adenylyltransferase